MANLMDLVRELKALNARKKSGEALTPGEEQRRKELKTYLRTTLESPGASSADGSPVREKAGSSSVSGEPVSMAPPETTQEQPRAAPRPISTPPAAAPLAASPPTPAPYVPRRDAYAIQNAEDVIGDAMVSDAVAKVDPFANRRAHASTAEMAEAADRADAALRANKRRTPGSPEEAEEQVRSLAAAYTPPADPFILEQYYGHLTQEGYARVDPREASHLKPVDPRELEVAKLDQASALSGNTHAVVPAGLAFLDDFPALYARRVLLSPDDEVRPESDDPSMLVPGKRKVTVHLLNGEKRQGAVRNLRRGELAFKLEPLGTGQSEDVALAHVKAVFIHQNPSTNAREPAGRMLTVTFRDQRAVQGVSDDYQPGAAVFTLVPQAGRGQFERIIVNAGAVAAIS